MRAAVLLFPGSNREGDAARALRTISAAHVDIVWHAQTELPKGTDLVVLPGGFSFGDYLRCGAIAARSPIMQAVRAHAERGGLVMGICNGFQILCESGLLPGVLMRNNLLKFHCKPVHLRVERTDTCFTSGYTRGEVMTVPCAHGEGNYRCDADTLKMLEDNGRVLFRYANEQGDVNEATNANGSLNNIAGIINAQGNVMGMMPHPENAIEALNATTHGVGLFKSLQSHIAQAA